MNDIIEEKPDKQEAIQIPEWLPAVPLHNAVLFPGATAPIAISSEEAVQAIELAAKGNRLFAAVTSKADDTDPVESINEIYRIGTAAFIIRMMRGPEDVTQLVTRGVSKVKIHSLSMRDGIPWVKVSVIPEAVERSSAIEALMRQLAEREEELIRNSPGIPSELEGLPTSLQNPHRLAYMGLSLTRSDKHALQKVYQVKTLERKLKLALKEVARELEIVDLGGKIQNEIETKLSQTEKEYYLREQLRAIRKELGEADDENQEIDLIREQIETTPLPEYVLEKVESELKRFERMPNSSPEYPMQRTYLEWLLEYPWLRNTQDKIDIRKAERILNEDHYNIKQVKERILEYLAVRKLNPNIKGPILCFVGPPGVGKTSLGQSIARALGRKFARLSLGGVHDEAEIRGHRRTYIGAMPGAIIQQIKRSRTNNPVFMLDEIDKIGRDFRGDPSSALLEVLDPAQNHAFRDHYMEIDIDLSQVLFIATANVPDRIQPPLRDRMEEIRLAGYTTHEKEQIALRYLVPRAVKENGLNQGDLQFGQGALEQLIRGYTREAGVRNLERRLFAVARKIAVKKTRNKWRRVKITKARLNEVLGPIQFTEEVAQRTARPGVATGLAWTSVGGEILFVEALPVRGGKGILLTGKLGDVMKESARAAISVIKSRSRHLGIDEKFFKENELHLHVPAGAVPKDGPSAGVTMATAVASAALRKPVRPDLAMTGEITLSGQVLPVGGIKEKIIAAHRAGIKTIMMPKRNEKDLEEIDKSIRKELTFIFAEMIEDVLKEALDSSKPKRRTTSKKRTSRKQTSRSRS
ncbi:MAG: endopeptidase La [Candidatus Hinthialibacter antarcticus]|nr:endopeptidase La [Candidatus Hinthialibacter antarcticus]